MEIFAAPIVLPEAFRLHPFVVERDQPDRFVRARLQIVPG